MAQIRIPPVLRPDAGNNRLFEVESATVREALDDLVAAFPALGSRVRDGDGVPTFLNVFIDGEDIRLLSGLDTPVLPTTTILLLPAVAGGAFDFPCSAASLPGMCRLTAPKQFHLRAVIACAQLA